jgi:hypothetical protein
MGSFEVEVWGRSQYERVLTGERCVVRRVRGRGGKMAGRRINEVRWYLKPW